MGQRLINYIMSKMMTFVFNNKLYHLLFQGDTLKIVSERQEPIFSGTALALEKSCLPIARLALQVYHYGIS